MPDDSEIRASRDAVADAAGVSSALWVSYLFVQFYLLVAVGGVTHANLFLEKPAKLPLLDAEIPLRGFCWLGPLLFLVAHAYVLLHMLLLADKAQDFEALLSRCKDAETWRRRLPVNVFVQLFAGPAAVRFGARRVLLHTIAWISLVFGPVLLLVAFELRFLPYHDEAITWWHRIAVLLDLVLLWVFWSVVTDRGHFRPAWQHVGRVATAGLAATGALAMLMVFGVATFPGETWERVIPRFPLRKALVAGDIDPATLRPQSLFSNRLVLPGFDAVARSDYNTNAKIAAVPVTLSLLSRHFEGAILMDATLSRINFSGAYLDGAVLNRARLQGAYLATASLVGAQLDDAALQGASLYEARLQGASMHAAQLQGASIAGAKLEGALLDGANVEGASLAGADLRGASLKGADLRGANLAQTWLDRADFTQAKLQGASLRGAFVRGADFAAATAPAPGIRMDNVELGPTPTSCPWTSDDPCDTADTPDAVRPIVRRYLPDRTDRAVLERLAFAHTPLPPATMQQREQAWQQLRSLAAADNPEPGLATLWGDIACAVDGAPFVVMGFLDTKDDQLAFRFGAESATLHALAATLLDKLACAGQAEESDETAMRLIELRPSTATASAAPRGGQPAP